MPSGMMTMKEMTDMAVPGKAVTDTAARDEGVTDMAAPDEAVTDMAVQREPTRADVPTSAPLALGTEGITVQITTAVHVMIASMEHHMVGAEALCMIVMKEVGAPAMVVTRVDGFRRISKEGIPGRMKTLDLLWPCARTRRAREKHKAMLVFSYQHLVYLR